MTRSTLSRAAAAVLLLPAATAQAAPIVFSAAGADAAAIQASVDGFRAALGGANNGNTPGFQPGGRREINWDGGGAGAPVASFPAVMTSFGFRGNVNVTPGTGFSISGQPSPEFADLNPTYADEFQAFSAPRLFAPLGSTITDVLFTKPGDVETVATTNGFGVVFTDVDLGFTTKVEFFNLSGTSLGSHVVEAFDKGLSFFGAIFDSAIIGRVRITAGNAALGPDDGGAIDVIALDDFLYGEPSPVPEPAAMALFGLAGAALAVVRTRRWKAR
jgi:hypothetical protein